MRLKHHQKKPNSVKYYSWSVEEEEDDDDNDGWWWRRVFHRLR